jgi:hypothetical protein
VSGEHSELYRQRRRLALAGFEEFRTAYSDWTAMAANVSKMSTLAAAGELIVAERAATIIGAVTYVSPHRPKPACVPHVVPSFSGSGSGRLWRA